MSGEDLQLLPSDAEEVARNIDFCMEAGDYETARSQLQRLIGLLSEHPLSREERRLADGFGSVMTNMKTGEVTSQMRPQTRQQRWVTPWEVAR